MTTPIQNLKFQRRIDFDQRDFIGDRELQEDYAEACLINNSSELLLVLADGMGGHASGEVASKKSVDTFLKTYEDFPSKAISSKLGAALQQANNEIAQSIQNSPALDGMGCTLVGVHVGSQGLQWISVGDSPLFLYRRGKLYRLNQDHSMAPVIEKSLQEGKISKEEAKNHPHRNALRSAITGGELSLIDTPSSPYVIQDRDVIVLASDGILSLSDYEIIEQIEANNQLTAENIAGALIAAVRAKRRPKQDNTTVQVLIVPPQFGGGGSTFRVSTLLLFVIFLSAIVLAIYFLNQQFQFFSLDQFDKNPKATSIIDSSKPIAPVPLPVSDEKTVDSDEKKTTTEKSESQTIPNKKDKINKESNSRNDKNQGNAPTTKNPKIDSNTSQSEQTKNKPNGSIDQVIQERQLPNLQLPIKEPVKDSAKEPIKEPVKEVAKEPVKDVVKESVKEVAKEPVKDVAKESVKEVTKEPVKEVVKESTKDISK